MIKKAADLQVESYQNRFGGEGEQAREGQEEDKLDHLI